MVKAAFVFRGGSKSTCTDDRDLRQTRVAATSRIASVLTFPAWWRAGSIPARWQGLSVDRGRFCRVLSACHLVLVILLTKNLLWNCKIGQSTMRFMFTSPHECTEERSVTASIIESERHIFTVEVLAGPTRHQSPAGAYTLNCFRL